MASVRGASADVICTAASIPRRSVRQTLARGPLRVPTFQRRYCWGTAQWNQLLVDFVGLAQRPSHHNHQPAASAAAPSPYSSHSLGRIVCADSDGETPGLMVIDGQQRLMTACIFLSAVRDVARHSSGASGADAAAAAAAAAADAPPLCDALEIILFPPAAGGQQVVTPTFFDRPAFAACLKGSASPPRSSSTAAVSSTSVTGPDQVTAARRFFAGALPHALARVCQKLGLTASRPEHCVLAARSLACACLDSCTVLIFKMQETGAEVLAAYSRLAMRDAMLSFQLNNKKPGVMLGITDLVRNLVCAQFPGNEEVRIQGYLQYWAPVEAWAMERVRLRAPSAVRQTCTDAQGKPTDDVALMVRELDAMIKAFVKMRKESQPRSARAEHQDASKKPMPKKKQWVDPGQYAFPVFTQLEECIADRGAMSMQELLRSMIAFAREFEDSPVTMAPPAARTTKKPATKKPACGGHCRVRYGTKCADCIVKASQASSGIK